MDLKPVRQYLEQTTRPSSQTVVTYILAIETLIPFHDDEAPS